MEWVLQVDQHWQLWPSCHTQCLVNRADGNKLGINKDLHATWKIFDESPARRDIYIRETDCDIFPLHFWKSRWVEDEPVAAWGIQIWKNIFQVVKYWLSLLKSKHHVITNHLIPWSSTKQINWWFWGCFYSNFKPVSQWFPSLLLSLM